MAELSDAAFSGSVLRRGRGETGSLLHLAFYKKSVLETGILCKAVTLVRVPMAPIVQAKTIGVGYGKEDGPKIDVYAI